MDSYRRAYAKVDLDAIKHNLTVTKKALKDNMKLAAVVKADGYGHGSVPVSLYIKDIVDFFCVATLEEGVNLRHYKPYFDTGMYSKKQLQRINSI